nr:MAG TPA: tail protein [Caudoviricetes sp.]
MKNKFNVIERFVTATPRSKRLAGSVTNGGVVISGSDGAGNSAVDPNSHTHANYELLEKLSEQDGYLTLKAENTSDDPDAPPYLYDKVKAGYSDDAGHADDSDLWAKHAFDDYLDQPLRKTDEAQFKAVVGSFRTPNFAGGMTGIGGLIDNKGNAELDSLKLRRFLEVPELNYNRVEISVGDDWSAPGGGVIASVDTDQRLVSLRLEEGEIGAVKAGDICMGIFHSIKTSENATADADDSRGNRTFAGFATAYFRITEVIGDHNEQFKYELRPRSATFTEQVNPMAAMTFVAYGSFTDASRRTSRYSTRSYQRYLRGVSDWEFTADNIAAQFGDLSNLAVFGLQMSGYSAYLDNIYMQGLLSSLDETFIIDTKTRSLLMASGETGIGLAFNPSQGLKIGAVYDPETGAFKKEYDIEQIAKTASDAKEDLKYLKNLFPQGASQDVDGAVIARTLAVKNDAGTQIMGFINGSSNFSDPMHGICMIAMGISSITDYNSAKTRLYASGHFVSDSAEITGKITAQTGIIGPFTISTSALTGAEEGSSLQLSPNLIRFADVYAKAYIGNNVFPSTLGDAARGPARFEVSRTASSGEANIGVYVSASGAADYDTMIDSGNHALYIPNGDICGFRVRVRRVSTSQVLSEMDSWILVTASGSINLTLPSSPQPGQLYFFKLIGSGKFNINIGASGHYISNNRNDRMTTWSFNSAPIIMLVWDRANKIWHGGHLNAG